jgi:YgiT-type zinc finger domain-containing protein
MNPIKMYGHLILKPKTDNMECVICKAGNMYEGKVTVALEKNGSIILIKEVPAHICDVCEHYYLDEQTAGEVLKRGSEGLLKGAELEVMKLKVA